MSFNCKFIEPSIIFIMLFIRKKKNIPKVKIKKEQDSYWQIDHLEN